MALNVPYYAVATLCMFAVLFGVGRLLLWRSSALCAGPLCLPICVAFGMVGFAAASFVLCCVGAWGVLAVRCGVAVGVLGCVLACRRRVSGEVGTPLPRGAVVGLALASVPLLLLFVHAVHSQVGWDAQSYHLAVPQIYLRHGGFRDVPYLVYSNWPLNFELLFGCALAVQDHVLARLLHWGCAGLLVYSLLAHGHEHGRPASGLFAAALLFGNQVVLREAVEVYVDLGQALFLFLAMVLWQRGALLACGVLLGFVAGMKLTGAVTVVILCAAHVLFGTGPWPHRVRQALLRLALPAFLLWLPWAIKSAVYTSNPVYPGMFSLFGGRYWNESLGQQLLAWQQSIGMGRGLFDYLALPYRITFESGPGYANFDGVLNPAWLLVFVVAVVGAVRIPAVRPWVFAAVAYAVYWALSSQQLRLLVPALPLFALAAAWTLGRQLEAFGRRWTRGVWVAPGALFVALTGLLVMTQGAELGKGRTFVPALASGLDDRVVPEAYRWINHNLKPKDKVLMLRTNWGYFCERDYIADSFFEASQTKNLMEQAGDLPALRHRLSKLGVTHILVGDNADTRYPDYFNRALVMGDGLEPVYPEARIYRLK